MWALQISSDPELQVTWLSSVGEVVLISKQGSGFCLLVSSIVIRLTQMKCLLPHRPPPPCIVSNNLPTNLPYAIALGLCLISTARDKPLPRYWTGCCHNSPPTFPLCMEIQHNTTYSSLAPISISISSFILRRHCSKSRSRPPSCIVQTKPTLAGTSRKPT